MLKTSFEERIAAVEQQSSTPKAPASLDVGDQGRQLRTSIDDLFRRIADLERSKGTVGPQQPSQAHLSGGVQLQSASVDYGPQGNCCFATKKSLVIVDYITFFSFKSTMLSYMN